MVASLPLAASCIQISAPPDTWVSGSIFTELADRSPAMSISALLWLPGCAAMSTACWPSPREVTDAPSATSMRSRSSPVPTSRRPSKLPVGSSTMAPSSRRTVSPVVVE
jgi:hypothetical protein